MSTFILTAEDAQGNPVPLKTEVFTSILLVAKMARETMKIKNVQNTEVLDVHGTVLHRIEKR